MHSLGSPSRRGGREARGRTVRRRPGDRRRSRIHRLPGGGGRVMEVAEPYAIEEALVHPRGNESAPSISNSNVRPPSSSSSCGWSSLWLHRADGRQSIKRQRVGIEPQRKAAVVQSRVAGGTGRRGSRTQPGGRLPRPRPAVGAAGR